MISLQPIIITPISIWYIKDKNLQSKNNKIITIENYKENTVCQILLHGDLL